MVPKMSIKAPTFSGTKLDDVTVWIWRMEVYLGNIHTPPEDYFSFVMFQVEGDAGMFLHDLVRKNNGQCSPGKPLRHPCVNATRNLLFTAKSCASAWSRSNLKDPPR